MTLTAKAVDAAKPKAKPYKLADSGGLYLAVLPTGGKSWRYNHSQNGKQKTKTYGTYPALSLAQARQCHAEFRDSPAIKGAPTFREVAEALIKIKLPTLKNIKHQGQFVGTLERFVYPAIGNLQIDAIKRADLVAVVKMVDAAGIVETAHRVAGRIGMVFDYAQDAGFIDAHPANDLTRVLRARTVKKHMASIDPGEAGRLMLDIETYPEIITRYGLALAAHTFVRVGELRLMRWDELKPDAWVIPGERMKMKTPHVVPLSAQVLTLLDKLRAITGDCELVLDSPAAKGKPVSENTFLFALYRLGYKGRMTVHGFRALASTVLNEQSPFNPDAIERQLSHKESDRVRAAYNRADYFDERKKLMQWWSDWLDAQAAVARQVAIVSTSQA